MPDVASLHSAEHTEDESEDDYEERTLQHPKHKKARWRLLKILLII